MMDTYEGLVIPFDCGEVGGETCEHRQTNRCARTPKTLGPHCFLGGCYRVRCRDCLYSFRNRDAFRRWETGQPDRLKEDL